MTDYAETKSISAYREMVRTSLEQYWQQSDQNRNTEPSFSYRTLDDLSNLSLPVLRNEHLRSDFREIINGLNSWKAHLHSWACWNGVIKTNQTKNGHGRFASILLNRSLFFA